MSENNKPKKRQGILGSLVRAILAVIKGMF
ncbi:hypothetical protein EDD63_1623 [Breznakia blatticola]|uniref:Uncharacterized protein n=1 Tax=Breznakia blatticola TaxID=1754012 RepID=A0A4R7Z9E2_9FIRM|nr:hypothetical protein EDD63_1623 [Breznakia blatticola]